MDETMKRWLERPPAEWSQATCYEMESKTDYQKLCRELDGLACNAAMLSAYLETRMGVVCTGQKPHEDAVKDANKRLVKIRRALGFSYPESGMFEF